MSYNLMLKAEKGFISLVRQTGDIPDGSFEIYGHQGELNTNLQISRCRADGSHAESASHSHSPEQPAEVAPDNEDLLAGSRARPPAGA